MISPFFIWLAAALLLALFEIGHPGLFFFLSFSLGALLAAGASLLSSSLSMQLTVCFAGTALAFFGLRHFIARSSGHGHRTNAEALIGKRGLVVERITVASPGRVRVGGETWLARSSRGQEIVEQTEITVVVVRGAHLVVSPRDEGEL